MKSRSIWIALLLITVTAYGQQRPQYTQYIFNNYLLNPAISGIEDYIDVKAGYRTQWVGLEGAPVTSYFSVNVPLGEKFIYGNANSFTEKGSNPMNRNYVQNYMAAEPHHGVGLHAVIDEAGPISRTDINATYAYHLGITEKLNISVGIAAGLSRVSLDVAKIRLENSGDPAIAPQQDNQLSPDLGVGVWMYGPRFFAGVSALQLLNRQLSFTDINSYDQGKLVPHYFITAGYKLFLTEGIAAIPSVMVKKVKPVSPSFDVNLKVALRDVFWVGGSYRKEDAFSAIAGFNVSHFFNVSYAYDFTMSDLKTASDGTHEIVIGLLLNNRYRVNCPQRNW